MRVARSPPSRESSVCKEIPFLHESLLRGLLLNGALHLGGSRARLHAHDTAAPGALDLLAVLVVLLADGSHELAELVPILRGDSAAASWPLLYPHTTTCAGLCALMCLSLITA